MSVKKTISSFLVFLTVFCILIFPKSATAEQTFNLCYSQCAAYKFIWQGDYCYDLFTQQCGVDSGNTYIKTIQFLKDVKGILQQGEGIDKIFTAWFVCKPLIQNCIVPQLTACRNTCQANLLYYAPDLSVGHPDSRYRGVIYDANNHKLIFKLINNGLGYAWDIDVSEIGRASCRERV